MVGKRSDRMEQGSKTQGTEDVMKIRLAGTLVEFSPESGSEVEDLSALWDIVVDCVKSNRKLVPVGEFIPANPDKSRVARFNIEDN